MSTDIEPRLDPELGDALRTEWHRFVSLFEPLRPELYRYCRALVGDPFDAEDLVQDTLMRAFSTLGGTNREVRRPRAWLFRVASNLWIDRMRRRREHPVAEPPEAAESPPPLPDTRAAAVELLVRLAPQERAAVLLKDVFDFSLAEVAETLTTTTGAVKSALRRARGKLSSDTASTEGAERETAASIVPGVLDAFCSAFNARDLDRLTALLLETASAEIVGMVSEYSRDDMIDEQTGSLYHTLFSPLEHAVDPSLLEGNRDEPRAEVRLVRGEPLVLIWYEHEDGPAVRDVLRFDVREDRIARLRSYFFSPDLLAAVCGELGLPWRTNGYRYVLG